MHLFLNPRARLRADAGAFRREDLASTAEFYERSDDAAPTPLVALPGLAAGLGICELLVKDESRRFGLNAFKITGVRYAVHRLLAGEGAGRRDLELACVSTGNHGRAVARVAAQHAIPAHVVVPAGTARSRVEAIAREDADVVVSDLGYDDAVADLARRAPARGWTIISDTAWPGYEAVPRDIMAGYTILLDEAQRQWPAPPDLVIVQAGVGGLAAAVVGWFALRFGAARPFIVVCEPDGAACLLASAEAGRRMTITGALDTHMAGLRCAEPSPLAWDTVGPLADAFVTIPDAQAERAMRALARPTGSDPVIDAGSSGASGVGALMAIVEDAALRPVRDAARLGSASRVLALVSEGVTDPDLRARVVDSAPA